ncbi:hypothetical protein AVEN_206681-1 [Araneus ventricosus]|uniref:Uncharacterized protein n=1 Tax=Araneus ventricosus TaxID=182803 RepID=A0A4Y2SU00_ARAVE|nr:hypothetical protein AVEN_206681-1 [Araneus ventricosus]
MFEVFFRTCSNIFPTLQSKQVFRQSTYRSMKSSFLPTMSSCFGIGSKPKETDRDNRNEAEIGSFDREVLRSQLQKCEPMNDRSEIAFSLSPVVVVSSLIHYS